ncbi:MAG: tRNA (adenosine(37)-N6)-dimethylallyltransferase MiaA [Phycisphaeraceae bacterium]|nr:MAG: tRNA (adenosine(37)-N6)-dimethylallyltransferase MiaA [Phycisphaeraceae bacterium]
MGVRPAAIEGWIAPVIVGPTAGGKSDLALALCDALHGVRSFGEVVTADSVQVYRGLDIGSAKPSPEERRGVPHHLIDLVEPDDPVGLTVKDWLGLSERAMADVRSRGGLPVVVGGTHLYVKALMEGLFEGPGADESVRDELRSMGRERLRAELERADPETASRLHPNDERRTVRALEVLRLTGRPISQLRGQWDRPGGGRGDCVLVGLEWPVREINARINARVRSMVERGLVEEARALWSAGRLGPRSRGALGYAQLIDHFEGRCGFVEALEAIKIETRRFAKNQRTWLRRLRTIPGGLWIDAAATPTGEVVRRVLSACGVG